MSTDVGIEVEASQLAFQLGQRLELLLLERGLELASQTGDSNVTAKQIEICLGKADFDEIVSSLKESIKNESGGWGTGKRETWEAA